MHQMVPQHFGTVSIPETVRTSKIKKYARLRVLTYIHTILRTEHFLIDAFSNVTFTSVHLYGTSYSNFRLTCSFTHYFSSSDSPHCSSITPCLFHCRLKTYLFHKSYSHTPVVSLHPPGLPSRTIAWTVSSELLCFCFIFPYFFVSLPCARLSCPSRQRLSAWVNVPYRIDV